MSRNVQLAALLGLLIVCAETAGCAGSAHIGVVPLNLKKLRDRDPLIRHLDARRCYYWHDEKGRLCIALEFENLSLIGDYGRRSLAMSLVLNEMPVGNARNYRANLRTLRMIARAGAQHVRWASLSGIVAIRRTPAGHIRGRFRIAAKQQKFHIALGWSSDSRVLLFGEFDAIPGEPEGRKILTRTEADGMDRTTRTVDPKR